MDELDGTSVRRVVAVMCLVGMALIHLIDLPDKIEEVPYIGWLFIGLIVSALVIAEGLIRHDDLLMWLAAGALAASTIAAYALSRTVGLPGEGGEEVGNWSESLGVSSLLIEACLVWLTVTRVAQRTAAGRSLSR